MSKMYPKSQAPFWQPANHVDTWKPVFFFTKLFGYAPVSKNSHGFYTTTSDAPFSVVAFILYVSMFGMTIFWHTRHYHRPLTDSKILDIGLNVSVLLCNATAVVIVVSNYVNRRKICDISRAIQTIDDELIKLGCQMTYRRELVLHIVQMIVAVIGQLALYGTCWYLRMKYEVKNLEDKIGFLYIGVTVTYSIYMTNFIFVMANIEKRYKAINQTMKKFFVKKPLALKSGLGYVCTKLAKLHDYLGDNVDAVNETFAAQVKMFKNLCFCNNFFFFR